MSPYLADRFRSISAGNMAYFSGRWSVVGWRRKVLRSLCEPSCVTHGWREEEGGIDIRVGYMEDIGADRMLPRLRIYGNLCYWRVEEI